MSTERFLARHLVAVSPHAMPLQEALAHIEERHKHLLRTMPEQPKTLETVPTPAADPVSEPKLFADDFWNRRRSPPASRSPKKASSSKPRGRQPAGNLGKRHGKFRVIDGSGDNRK